jgi:uncharacterized membrane protein YfcA
VAGIAAGGINAVVGSGTLITFPILLAVGYEPVVANVSNTVGLVLGSAAAAWGYRAELEGQRHRLVRMGCASLAGGVTGAILLLMLPDGAFKAIVPVLIVVACILVLVQPRLVARLRPLRREGRVGPLLLAGVYAAGIYGGYFGAAQGVLLIGILGVGLREDLQRINAAKNVLAGLVNLVAALFFVVAADIAWAPAGLLAAGSVLGGQLGATIGRRLSPVTLRGFIVAVGTVAVIRLLT